MVGEQPRPSLSNDSRPIWHAMLISSSADDQQRAAVGIGDAQQHLISGGSSASRAGPRRRLSPVVFFIDVFIGIASGSSVLMGKRTARGTRAPSRRSPGRRSRSRSARDRHRRRRLFFLRALLHLSVTALDCVRRFTSYARVMFSGCRCCSFYLSYTTFVRRHRRLAHAAVGAHREHRPHPGLHAGVFWLDRAAAGVASAAYATSWPTSSPCSTCSSHWPPRRTRSRSTRRSSGT